MSRPEKPIDWDIVDELIIQQNSGAQIASRFNLYPDTFYDRVKSKWGITFTNYAGVKYSEGISLLKSKQWEKAMEGNIQMLLKLGELYADQAQDIDSDIKITIIDARSDCST